MKALNSAGRAPFLIIILIALTMSSLSFAQTYTVTDLGDSLGGNSSGARAVNASAQITGYAYASGNNVSDVFLYSKATMTSLGTLGGTTGTGNGINISGQVAGYSTDSGGNYRAFISRADISQTSATSAETRPSPMASTTSARSSAPLSRESSFSLQQWSHDRPRNSGIAQQ